MNDDAKRRVSPGAPAWVEEELREALVDLETSRSREERLRTEAEGLFEALRVMTGAGSVQTMFEDLLAVLGGFLPFEHGFVLMEANGRFEALISTSSIFDHSRWKPGKTFERVLAGATLAFHDVSALPEWREQPEQVREHTGSALVSAVDMCDGTKAILVLTHGRRAAFSNHDRDLLKRFGPLTAQAVMNLLHRESLEDHQDMLEKQKEALERSNADLERFAYVASHDLQEPLRTVTSYLQLLERRLGGRLSDDEREYLDFVVDGARRMSSLVKGLMEFSRVEYRADDYAEIPASRLIQAAADNLRALIRETGAGVTWPEDLPEIRCDSVQMVTVFQNLMGNALKYRAEDRRPEVEVQARRREGALVFSVRDNGIGIEPRYFRKVFEMFKRLHGRGHYDGAGIGLSLVEKIVALHGGAVWLESEPGEGSTFFFSLPVEAPEPRRRRTRSA